MKKLLVIISLLCSVAGISQVIVVPHYQLNPTNFEFGIIKINKSFVPPLDTLSSAADSSIAIKNGILFQKLGGVWGLVAGGSAGGFWSSSVGTADVLQTGPGLNYVIDSLNSFSLMAGEIRFDYDNIIDVEDSADYYMVVQNKDGKEIGQAPWPDQTKARFGYPGEDANIDVGREITFNQVQLSMAGLSSFNVLSNNLANTFGSVIYTNPTQNYLGGYNDDPAGAPFVGTSLNGIIYGGSTTTHRKAVAMGIGDAAQIAEFFVLLDSSDFKLKAATYNIDGLVEVSDSTDYKAVVADASGNLFRMNSWPGTGTGGGSANSNVGSFFRILKPSSQELKTLAPGFGFAFDSTTNTNAITFKLDTANAALKAFVRDTANVLFDSLGAAGISPVTVVNNIFKSRRISISGGSIDTTASGGILITVSASGETNTASNLGGGLANWDSKSGVDLRFNTFLASDFNLASNLISIDYANGQAATSSLNGFITAGTQTIGGAKTWTGAPTFNALVNAAAGLTTGTGVAANILALNASSASSASHAAVLFKNGSNTAARVFFNGSTNYAVGVGSNVGSLTKGQNIYTAPGSGINNYYAGMVLINDTIISGGATSIAGATLVITNAPVGTEVFSEPVKAFTILAGDQLIETGKLGIGISNATTIGAKLHLGAGAAAAGTAPLLFTSGTNLTTPVNGAMEYNGTDYFITKSSTRLTLATIDGTETFTNKTLSTSTSVSASLSFADGVKQTFNPNGTNAGFNPGAHTADPSSGVNGDQYYNSTANEMRAYINGAWVAWGAGTSINYAWQSITDGATLTFDASSYINASTTLGGNRTIAFSNLASAVGKTLTYELIQDGTGSRTITLPGICKVVNGGGGAITLTSTPGASDILQFVVKSTSLVYVTYGPNFN